MTATSEENLNECTPSELLTVISARCLGGRRRVFAGIGLPTLAVALAQATTEPDLEQVYESGVCGAHPPRLPQTIADAPLATGAECILGMHALFGYVLQGGHIDVGFLGGAQIDRWGNLNSTVIGDYTRPTVRLPGSGGAAEVMANAAEVFVVLRRHTPTSLVEELDFCTSPAPLRARRANPNVRTTGRGVSTVITDLGVLTAGDDGELTLSAVHPGVRVADVTAATGWPLRVATEVAVTEPPTPAELGLLRDTIDPTRVYLR
ncbi:glutaconate CoA-transferase subunit B [Lipingzhangella halophila]|uniref:Glutaconate CoA-transferase subunit B n=1 Tax=Lipingzhangella halophila TaxID=1783352 RepID=A0A7W7W4B2_9ACTN|nr:CoA-transferase [Lipingzhangella halophila]MBB4932669.1 glutaconate CoA-transferase subunit B [Lipingzhangella halophila]